MKERELPKPNTQALSWFYGENKKSNLVLNPKYQRNPIWSIGQKCFLIDSLISGSPIPQVFITIQPPVKSRCFSLFHGVCVQLAGLNIDGYC